MSGETPAMPTPPAIPAPTPADVTSAAAATLARAFLADHNDGHPLTDAGCPYCEKETK